MLIYEPLPYIHSMLTYLSIQSILTSILHKLYWCSMFYSKYFSTGDSAKCSIESKLASIAAEQVTYSQGN